MIVGSNRLNFINPNEKRKLIMMGKEGCSEVEEGEISDEEQTIAEINKDEDLKKKKKKMMKQQVWKMEDLMKYSSNYATGLYNFAWAQAVSNKPFNNGITIMEEEEEEFVGSDDEKLNKIDDDDDDNKSLSCSKDDDCNVLLSEEMIDDDDGSKMVDVEKEEGELEEGEIDLDCEMMGETEVTTSSSSGGGGGGGGGDLILDMVMVVESNEDEKQVEEEEEVALSDINEEAFSETDIVVEKSLHGDCSKLRSTLDSLLQMVVVNGASCVDAIIPEYFARIQALNSMFCSMNSKQQELEIDGLSRLLAHVKGQCCALFSPDQLNEVEDMMRSLETLSIFSSVKAMDNHEDMRGSGVSTTQLGILGEVPVCSSVKVMNNHEDTRGNSGVSRNQLGILGEIPVCATVKATNNHEVIPAKCEVSRNQLGILGENPVCATVKATNNHEVIPANCEMSRNQLGILGENPGQVLNSSKKFFLEPITVKFGDQSSANVGSEKMKFGPSSGSKGRGRFGPLLDLHMDHDVDSLPSPTRETPKPLPIQKMQAVEDAAIKSELGNARVADRNEAHSYETDALKAVSTYQKKFGQTSFHHSTRLPSPTPSDESNDGGDDSKGEVSSSAVSNVGTFNPPISMPAVSSATSQKDSSSTYRFGPAKTVERLESGSNPVSKLMAKSRDPRLRVGNSRVGTMDFNQRSLYGEHKAQNESLGGITSSRKHQISAESMSDGQSLKRPRNGLTDPRVSGDAPILSRSGGWLQESSTVRPQPAPRSQLAGNMGTDFGRFENGVVSGFRQDTTTSGNLHARAVGNEQFPLPSLLKDIAVNPTMLIKLFMEQQRFAAEAKLRSSNPAQNSTACYNLGVLQGAIPLPNVSSSKSSGTEQTHAIKSEVPTQTISTAELVKVRMKPRDPRRILQNSSFQNNESISMSQANKDNSVVRQQGEQSQTTTMPSHSTPAPDIAQQFTKGLKNVAHLLSASQATKSAPIAPQTLSSQALLGKMDTSDMASVAAQVKDQQNGPGLKPEEEIEGRSQPQNKWEDVEHLFEGYDDEQKAAIHRERARRLEEQNKMFAARKLCLVLDLDHTLLNSAKFIEVDPVHDEILRIMEEQDREKPYRHLFRFSHMGMWTKLRPGVWNFLEKASKLFELHLYTMGNKLYATEMAKVLDPTGVLFSGRVISKGDDGDPFDGDERVPKTKDLEGVMGMESSVVIIDDSVRVWPHNKLNLIVVERYTYFPCSRRQFGLPGPSLLEIDRDERPEDGTLASSLAVIERIHDNFFSHKLLHDVDVRNILASEQRKILGGCCILFSRVIPVGEINPHLHPLWQSAEQFGALCTNQIDEQVTHVVANSLGTDKVNWALSTGRFVVYPSWVEASALLYRRANEHDFAIKP